jgi:hypothetical protein
MKEKKGKFEETVRSKLYGFKSDTDADIWDMIAARLPAGKTVKLFPLKKYSAVAAAIAALTILAGGLFYFNARRDEGAETRRSENAKVRMGEWAKVQIDEDVKERRDEGTKARRDESAKA